MLHSNNEPSSGAHLRRARAVLLRDFRTAWVPFQLLSSLVCKIEGNAELLYGVCPLKGGRLLLWLLLRHGDVPLHIMCRGARSQCMRRAIAVCGHFSVWQTGRLGSATKSLSKTEGVVRLLRACL